MGKIAAEDDRTPVDVPMVLTTKEFLGSQCSYADYCNGQVTATFRNRMVNAGNVRLDRISVEDDFAAQIGPGFISTNVSLLQIEPPTNATTWPTKNPLWNGRTNTFIFQNTGILDIGQNVTYAYTAFIDPSAPGAPFPLENQTETSARGLRVTGAPVVLADLVTQKFTDDLSDAGDDPYTTNPGFDGDTGGSNDATEYCIPRIIVQPADITLNACDPEQDEDDWVQNHASAVVQSCYPIICWLNEVIENKSLGCGLNESRTYKFTAKDSYGNEICFCRKVTIQDNTGPFWDMNPMDKTVACGSGAQAMVQAWLDDDGGGWVFEIVALMSR